VGQLPSWKALRSWRSTFPLRLGQSNEAIACLCEAEAVMVWTGGGGGLVWSSGLGASHWSYETNRHGQLRVSTVLGSLPTTASR